MKTEIKTSVSISKVFHAWTQQADKWSNLHEHHRTAYVPNTGYGYGHVHIPPQTAYIKPLAPEFTALSTLKKPRI